VWQPWHSEQLLGEHLWQASIGSVGVVFSCRILTVQSFSFGALLLGLRCFLRHSESLVTVSGEDVCNISVMKWIEVM